MNGLITFVDELPHDDKHYVATRVLKTTTSTFHHLVHRAKTTTATARFFTEEFKRYIDDHGGIQQPTETLIFEDGLFCTVYTAHFRTEDAVPNVRWKQWYDGGSLVREHWDFSPIVQEQDKAVIKGYVSFIDPPSYPALFDRLDSEFATDLWAFFRQYWQKEKRVYYYQESTKRSSALGVQYAIDLVIEGIEEYPISVLYNPQRKHIFNLHIKTLSFTHLKSLFHVQEIQRFIEEEAPCRLEFLFHETN